MTKFLRLLFAACFTFILLHYSYAQSGNALHFDGIDDQVNCTLPSFFTTNSDFTFEAWVNPQGNAFSRIIFAQLSTSNFATLSINTGNSVYFYVIKNGTTYSVATTTTIPANQWTHVATRWISASNSLQVFFNGVPQSTIAGGSSSTGTNNMLSIGTRPGGTQYFTGQLDEVRIWTSALSDCNITANMHKALIGNEQNLALYYNFNHGTAGGNNAGIITLTDLVASNNGTLSNFALTGNSSNWIASGVTLTPGSTNNTTETFSVCPGSNHTFPDGTVQNNITAAVSHTSLLQTINGCDSSVVTNITVNPTFSTNNPQTICQGEIYTFNGHDYTVQGSYNDTLQTISGCDSVVATQLFVNPTYNTNHLQSICAGDIYSFAGVEYFSAGNYPVTFQSISGCDSIVTLILTVDSIDNSIIGTSVILFANENGATYQWINCEDNSIVNGFTSQSFTPSTAGYYAVIITKNGCMDTSACYLSGNASVSENAFENNISVFPNPTSGLCTIELGETLSEIEIGIINVLGQQTAKKKYNQTSLLTIELEGNSGIYFLVIKSGNRSAIIKVLKQ